MNKNLKSISKIAKKTGINPKDLYFQGDFIAKIADKQGKKSGKLVLVTAMTSNKTGIGKTTVSIGLSDALNKLGKKSILALREPSMGPVFGIKGGATGGGMAMIEPSDDINLHFTGDFHAVTQANNLLASVIDNHIFQGNELDIDIKNIFFKRCLDVNDRSLRNIVYKIGKQEVETGFNITAASEIMAVLCLSENLQDLKVNLGKILVALNKKGQPIFAKDLKVEEAMTILLKDALLPNIVQTKESNLALVHLGPFANIAHGCNSLMATKLALSYGDFCVTEAGFGSDLGAEKFIDIKCRKMGKSPDVVVLVVVLKVIKEHGEGDIIAGFENVKKHLENLKNIFGANVVVAINKHSDDDEKELKLVSDLCVKEGVLVEICDAFGKGGTGCLDLAKKVLKLSSNQNNMKFCYSLEDALKTKIEKIACKVYGARKVSYSEIAENKIQLANKLGFENFFVNIAKTQFSFSDDKNLLGAPKDFEFFVNDIEIRSGANMIVAIAGNMLLMPALGKKSNYLNMKIDNDGDISGLF